MLAGRNPQFIITGPDPRAVAQYYCIDTSSDPASKFTVDIPPPGAENYFQGIFFAAHGETGLKENNKDGSFVLSHAVFRNDRKYIEAIYNYDVDNEIHETSTFIIYHTPVE
jgi:hypothetical protein